MFAVTATVLLSVATPFDATMMMFAVKPDCTEQLKATATSTDPFAGTVTFVAPSVSAAFDGVSVAVIAAPVRLVIFSVPIGCGHAVIPTE